MAKNLVITGAGASVHAGAPLMSNFLDRAEDLLVEGLFEEHSETIKKLFEFRSALRLIYANSTLDLGNIESVLGALEMGITVGGVPGYTKEKLQKLLLAAKHMIARTIDESVKFGTRTFSPFEWSLYSPEVCLTFVDRIKAHLGSDVAFITFNYDLALDMSIIQLYGGVRYGLPDDPNPSEAPYLLKLHGSVGWATQSKTAAFHKLDLSRYLVHRVGEPTGRSMLLRSMKELEKNAGGTLVPFIVPPSWNKTQHHPLVTNIWNRAAAELSIASRIFVIGYSLPESDSFFKYLFALGTMRNDKIRKMVVVDLDIRVENRFKGLIGAGLQDRFKFDHQDFGVIAPSFERYFT